MRPLIQQCHVNPSTREPAAVPPAGPVSATKRLLGRQRTGHSNVGNCTGPVHKCAIKALGCVLLIKRTLLRLIFNRLDRVRKVTKSLRVMEVLRFSLPQIRCDRRDPS